MAEAAERVGFLLPVLKSAWDARTPQDEAFWLQVAQVAMARVGKVVSELEREVREETKIDGFRLHGYDEDGNELPETVMLRYTAFAVRYKEVR